VSGEDKERAHRQKLAACANEIQNVVIGHKLSGSEAIEVFCMMAATQTAGGVQSPVETIDSLVNWINRMMNLAARPGGLGAQAIVVPGAGGKA
jgi:hypothetical protein